MTQLKTDQVAVVTGAASGIGLALAAAFVERGLSVVMADLHADVLKDAVSRLSGQGSSAVIGVPTDVSQAEAVDRLAEAALAEFGRVDIVCNNAGVFNGFVPCWEIPLSDWRRIIDVNILGVVHGIRSFVPRLVQQGHGHVLNTSSMSGVSSVPGNGDYVMTKHAVVSITETLRADLDAAAPAVGATVLCPGPTQTPMVEAGFRKLKEAAAAGTLAPSPGSESSAVLPGTTVIEPERVAECALAAIEANRLYALPAADSEARIRPRIDRLLSELAIAR